MVFLVEHHFIVPLCLIVGRIAVKKGIRPVIVADEDLKVLVLYHRVLQPSVRFPQDVKGLCEVCWLAAEGSASASVAVTDDLKESRRPFNIPPCGASREDLLYLLCLLPFQGMGCDL